MANPNILKEKKEKQERTFGTSPKPLPQVKRSNENVNLNTRKSNPIIKIQPTYRNRSFRPYSIKDDRSNYNPRASLETVEKSSKLAKAFNQPKAQSYSWDKYTSIDQFTLPQYAAYLNQNGRTEDLENLSASVDTMHSQFYNPYLAGRSTQSQEILDFFKDNYGYDGPLDENFFKTFAPLYTNSTVTIDPFSMATKKPTTKSSTEEWAAYYYMQAKQDYDDYDLPVKAEWDQLRTDFSNFYGEYQSIYGRAPSYQECIDALDYNNYKTLSKIDASRNAASEKLIALNNGTFYSYDILPGLYYTLQRGGSIEADRDYFQDAINYYLNPNSTAGQQKIYDWQDYDFTQMDDNTYQKLEQSISDNEELAHLRYYRYTANHPDKIDPDLIRLYDTYGYYQDAEWDKRVQTALQPYLDQITDFDINGNVSYRNPGSKASLGLKLAYAYSKSLAMEDDTKEVEESWQGVKDRIIAYTNATREFYDNTDEDFKNFHDDLMSQLFIDADGNNIPHSKLDQFLKGNLQTRRIIPASEQAIEDMIQMAYNGEDINNYDASGKNEQAAIKGTPEEVQPDNPAPEKVNDISLDVMIHQYSLKQAELAAAQEQIDLKQQADAIKEFALSGANVSSSDNPIELPDEVLEDNEAMKSLQKLWYQSMREHYAEQLGDDYNPTQATFIDPVLKTLYSSTDSEESDSNYLDSMTSDEINNLITISHMNNIANGGITPMSAMMEAIIPDHQELFAHLLDLQTDTEYFISGGQFAHPFDVKTYNTYYAALQAVGINGQEAAAKAYHAATEITIGIKDIATKFDGSPETQNLFNSIQSDIINAEGAAETADIIKTASDLAKQAHTADPANGLLPSTYLDTSSFTYAATLGSSDLASPAYRAETKDLLHDIATGDITGDDIKEGILLAATQSELGNDLDNATEQALSNREDTSVPPAPANEREFDLSNVETTDEPVWQQIVDAQGNPTEATQEQKDNDFLSGILSGNYDWSQAGDHEISLSTDMGRMLQAEGNLHPNFKPETFNNDANNIPLFDVLTNFIRSNVPSNEELQNLAAQNNPLQSNEQINAKVDELKQTNAIYFNDEDHYLFGLTPEEAEMVRSGTDISGYHFENGQYTDTSMMDYILTRANADERMDAKTPIYDYIKGFMTIADDTKIQANIEANTMNKQQYDAIREDAESFQRMLNQDVSSPVQVAISSLMAYGQCFSEGEIRAIIGAMQQGYLSGEEANTIIAERFAQYPPDYLACLDHMDQLEDTTTTTRTNIAKRTITTETDQKFMLYLANDYLTSVNRPEAFTPEIESRFAELLSLPEGYNEDALAAGLERFIWHANDYMPITSTNANDVANYSQEQANALSALVDYYATFGAMGMQVANSTTLDNQYFQDNGITSALTSIDGFTDTTTMAEVLDEINPNWSSPYKSETNLLDPNFYYSSFYSVINAFTTAPANLAMAANSAARLVTGHGGQKLYDEEGNRLSTDEIGGNQAIDDYYELNAIGSNRLALYDQNHLSDTSRIIESALVNTAEMFVYGKIGSGLSGMISKAITGGGILKATELSKLAQTSLKLVSNSPYAAAMFAKGNAANLQAGHTFARSFSVAAVEGAMELIFNPPWEGIADGDFSDSIFKWMNTRDGLIADPVRSWALTAANDIARECREELSEDFISNIVNTIWDVGEGSEWSTALKDNWGNYPQSVQDTILATAISTGIFGVMKMPGTMQSAKELTYIMQNGIDMTPERCLEIFKQAAQEGRDLRELIESENNSKLDAAALEWAANQTTQPIERSDAELEAQAQLERSRQQYEETAERSELFRDAWTPEGNYDPATQVPVLGQRSSKTRTHNRYGQIQSIANNNNNRRNNNNGGNQSTEVSITESIKDLIVASAKGESTQEIEAKLDALGEQHRDEQKAKLEQQVKAAARSHVKTDANGNPVQTTGKQSGKHARTPEIQPSTNTKAQTPVDVNGPTEPTTEPQTETPEAQETKPKAQRRSKGAKRVAKFIDNATQETSRSLAYEAQVQATQEAIANDAQVQSINEQIEESEQQEAQIQQQIQQRQEQIQIIDQNKTAAIATAYNMITDGSDPMSRPEIQNTVFQLTQQKSALETEIEEFYQQQVEALQKTENLRKNYETNLSRLTQLIALEYTADKFQPVEQQAEQQTSEAPQKSRNQIAKERDKQMRRYAEEAELDLQKKTNSVGDSGKSLNTDEQLEQRAKTRDKANAETIARYQRESQDRKAQLDSQLEEQIQADLDALYQQLNESETTVDNRRINNAINARRTFARLQQKHNSMTPLQIRDEYQKHIDRIKTQEKKEELAQQRDAEIERISGPIQNPTETFLDNYRPKSFVRGYDETPDAVKRDEAIERRRQEHEIRLQEIIDNPDDWIPVSDSFVRSLRQLLQGVYDFNDNEIRHANRQTDFLPGYEEDRQFMDASGTIHTIYRSKSYPTAPAGFNITNTRSDEYEHYLESERYLILKQTEESPTSQAIDKFTHDDIERFRKLVTPDENGIIPIESTNERLAQLTNQIETLQRNIPALYAKYMQAVQNKSGEQAITDTRNAYKDAKESLNKATSDWMNLFNNYEADKQFIEDFKQEFENRIKRKATSLETKFKLRNEFYQYQSDWINQQPQEWQKSYNNTNNQLGQLSKELYTVRQRIETIEEELAEANLDTTNNTNKKELNEELSQLRKRREEIKTQIQNLNATLATLTQSMPTLESYALEKERPKNTNEDIIQAAETAFSQLRIHTPYLVIDKQALQEQRDKYNQDPYKYAAEQMAKLESSKPELQTTDYIEALARELALNHIRQYGTFPKGTFWLDENILQYGNNQKLYDELFQSYKEALTIGEKLPEISETTKDYQAILDQQYTEETDRRADNYDELIKERDNLRKQRNQETNPDKISQLTDQIRLLTRQINAILNQNKSERHLSNANQLYSETMLKMALLDIWSRQYERYNAQYLFNFNSWPIEETDLKQFIKSNGDYFNPETQSGAFTRGTATDTTIEPWLIRRSIFEEYKKTINPSAFEIIDTTQLKPEEYQQAVQQIVDASELSPEAQERLKTAYEIRRKTQKGALDKYEEAAHDNSHTLLIQTSLKEDNTNQILKSGGEYDIEQAMGLIQTIMQSIIKHPASTSENAIKNGHNKFLENVMKILVTHYENGVKVTTTWGLLDEATNAALMKPDSPEREAAAKLAKSYLESLPTLEQILGYAARIDVNAYIYTGKNQKHRLNFAIIPNEYVDNLQKATTSVDQEGETHYLVPGSQLKTELAQATNRYNALFDNNGLMKGTPEEQRQYTYYYLVALSNRISGELVTLSKNWIQGLYARNEQARQAVYERAQRLDAKRREIGNQIYMLIQGVDIDEMFDGSHGGIEAKILQQLRSQKLEANMDAWLDLAKEAGTPLLQELYIRKNAMTSRLQSNFKTIIDPDEDGRPVTRYDAAEQTVLKRTLDSINQKIKLMEQAGISPEGNIQQENTEEKSIFRQASDLSYEQKIRNSTPEELLSEIYRLLRWTEENQNNNISIAINNLQKAINYYVERETYEMNDKQKLDWLMKQVTTSPIPVNRSQIIAQQINNIFADIIYGDGDTTAHLTPEQKRNGRNTIFRIRQNIMNDKFTTTELISNAIKKLAILSNNGFNCESEINELSAAYFETKAAEEANTTTPTSTEAPTNAEVQAIFVSTLPAEEKAQVIQTEQKIKNIEQALEDHRKLIGIPVIDEDDASAEGGGDILGILLTSDNKWTTIQADSPTNTESTNIEPVNTEPTNTSETEATGGNNNQYNNNNTEATNEPETVKDISNLEEVPTEAEATGGNNNNQNNNNNNSETAKEPEIVRDISALPEVPTETEATGGNNNNNNNNNNEQPSTSDQKIGWKAKAGNTNAKKMLLAQEEAEKTKLTPISIKSIMEQTIQLPTELRKTKAEIEELQNKLRELNEMAESEIHPEQREIIDKEIQDKKEELNQAYQKRDEIKAAKVKNIRMLLLAEDARRYIIQASTPAPIQEFTGHPANPDHKSIDETGNYVTAADVDLTAPDLKDLNDKAQLQLHNYYTERSKFIQTTLQKIRLAAAPYIKAGNYTSLTPEQLTEIFDQAIGEQNLEMYDTISRQMYPELKRMKEQQAIMQYEIDILNAYIANTNNDDNHDVKQLANQLQNTMDKAKTELINRIQEIYRLRGNTEEDKRKTEKNNRKIIEEYSKLSIKIDTYIDNLGKENKNRLDLELGYLNEMSGILSSRITRGQDIYSRWRSMGTDSLIDVLLGNRGGHHPQEITYAAVQMLMEAVDRAKRHDPTKLAASYMSSPQRYLATFLKKDNPVFSSLYLKPIERANATITHELNKLDKTRKTLDEMKLSNREQLAVIECIESGYENTDEVRAFLEENGINTDKTSDIFKAMQLMRATLKEIYTNYDDALERNGMDRAHWWDTKTYVPHINIEENPILRALGINSNEVALPTNLFGKTEDTKAVRKWHENEQRRTNEKIDPEKQETNLSNILKSYGYKMIQNTYQMDNAIRIQDLTNAINAMATYTDSGYADPDVKERLSHARVFLDELRYQIVGKKTSDMERALEKKVRRYIPDAISHLLHLKGRQATGGNLRPVAANFLPVITSLGQHPIETSKAIYQVLARRAATLMADEAKNQKQHIDIKSDSDWLYTRTGRKEYERSKVEKTLNTLLYGIFNLTDDFTSEITTQAGCNVGMKLGMNKEQAFLYAGNYARNIMGSKATGEAPKMAKGITHLMFFQFMMEPVNQIQNWFYDMPEFFNSTSSSMIIANAKVIGALGLTMVLCHALNKLLKGTVAPDLPEAVEKAKEEYDETGSLKDALIKGAGELYSSFNPLWDIDWDDPIGSMAQAIPILSMIQNTVRATKNIVTIDDRDELPMAIWNLVKEWIPGGAAINRVVQTGVAAHQGYAETSTGRIKYMFEPTFGNLFRGSVFGLSSTSAADDYHARGDRALTTQQTNDIKALIADQNMTPSDAYKQVMLQDETSKMQREVREGKLYWQDTSEQEQALAESRQSNMPLNYHEAENPSQAYQNAVDFGMNLYRETGETTYPHLTEFEHIGDKYIYTRSENSVQRKFYFTEEEYQQYIKDYEQGYLSVIRQNHTKSASSIESSLAKMNTALLKTTQQGGHPYYGEQETD